MNDNLKKIILTVSKELIEKIDFGNFPKEFKDNIASAIKNKQINFLHSLINSYKINNSIDKRFNSFLTLEKQKKVLEAHKKAESLLSQKYILMLALENPMFYMLFVILPFVDKEAIKDEKKAKELEDKVEKYLTNKDQINKELDEAIEELKKLNAEYKGEGDIVYTRHRYDRHNKQLEYKISQLEKKLDFTKQEKESYKDISIKILEIIEKANNNYKPKNSKPKNKF